MAGFDFMEDRPLNARIGVGDGGGGSDGRSGGNNAGRGSGEAPVRSSRRSERVASLFEILQALSVPPTPQRFTSARTGVTAPTTPSALAQVSATKVTPLVGSSSTTARSQERRRPNGRGSESAAPANARKERLNANGDGSLSFPRRPTPWRVDQAGGVASGKARRVTFVGTGEPRHGNVIVAATSPSPTPFKRALDRPRDGAAAAAFTPTRPTRPTKIRGGGINAHHGTRPRSRSPGAGTTKKRALGSITSGKAGGPESPAGAPAGLVLRPSPGSAAAETATALGTAMVAEGVSEERSVKRRCIDVGKASNDREDVVAVAGRPSASDERGAGGVGAVVCSGQVPVRWCMGGERRMGYAGGDNGRAPQMDTDDGPWTTQGAGGLDPSATEPPEPGGDSGKWLSQGDPGGSNDGLWMSQDTSDTCDPESVEVSRPQGSRAQTTGEGRKSRLGHQEIENAEALRGEVGGGRFSEKGDDGRMERSVEGLGREQDWNGDVAAVDREDDEERDRHGVRKDLLRVRGLCRMKGATLALVEWNVVESSGDTATELSFMLASTLKADWPQQYIAYLEEKMVFMCQNDATGAVQVGGGGDVGATSEDAGSELVVWNSSHP